MALKAARLPPESLVFQISEADATSYLKQAKQLTQGLATLHCQAAISQFGCSLNPFNALKHLTVQFIKIDGSFVQDLNQVENQEILKGLIAELHEQQKLSIVPSSRAPASSPPCGKPAPPIQGYLQGPSQAMDYDFSSGRRRTAPWAPLLPLYRPGSWLPGRQEAPAGLRLALRGRGSRAGRGCRPGPGSRSPAWPTA